MNDEPATNNGNRESRCRPSSHFLKRCLQSRIWLAILLITIPLYGCSTRGSGSTNAPETSENVEGPVAQESSPQPTPFSLQVLSPTPAPGPTTAPTPIDPPTPQIVRTELVTTIDTLLSSEPGVYGVVLLNESGDYLYARNADVPFVAASLYKLVLLAEIYSQIDQGTLNLSDSLPLLETYFDDQFAEEDGYFTSEDAGGEITVEQALFGAGAYSSNIAAKILMDLTSIPNLHVMAESLGMRDTFFNAAPAQLPAWPDRYTSAGNPDALLGVAFVETQAMYGPVNITTPNDIARFWLALLQGRVVSAEASAAILEILRQQVVTDRIPWLLPDEMTTANKTGNLYHVVHDSGIIFEPQGSIVLAVLSEGEPEDDHGAQVIQRIALASTGETQLPPFTVNKTASPVNDSR